MDRDRLLLWVAAVLAGLAVALAVTALAVQPFVLVVAVPLGVAAYVVWHRATGRIGSRLRDRVEERRRAAREHTRRTATSGWETSRTRSADGGVVRDGNDLSRREAYHVLGLSPDADEAAVRRAYRERAKEVHPDAEAGSREAFKRVNLAYERLTE